MKFVHWRLNKCTEIFLLRIARIEMDCVVKKNSLNFSKFWNHLLGKIKMHHGLLFLQKTDSFFALVLTFKAYFWLEKRENYFSALARKQKKCHNRARLAIHCHSKNSRILLATSIAHYYVRKQKQVHNFQPHTFWNNIRIRSQSLVNSHHMRLLEIKESCDELTDY